MNKAFIFDMDGVIIDTERIWAKYEKEFHNELFGTEIAEKVGSTLGMSLSLVYELAISYGFSIDRQVFDEKYHTRAQTLYRESAITEGFESLVFSLKENDIAVGLVSASPLDWINFAFAKTSVRNHFDYILSLHEQDTLQHKPSPDGYIEAMKYLQSTPETTIVLEDSNRGIQSAKASGAFTIGFTQNLQTGYVQRGADVYADSMDEVLCIVKERFYE